MPTDPDFNAPTPPQPLPRPPVKFPPARFVYEDFTGFEPVDNCLNPTPEQKTWPVASPFNADKKSRPEAPPEGDEVPDPQLPPPG